MPNKPNAKIVIYYLFHTNNALFLKKNHKKPGLFALCVIIEYISHVKTINGNSYYIILNVVKYL